MAYTAPAPTNSPFLKQLASSSSRTRSEALDHLRTYLRSRASLTHPELLKLWKGLFYSVWHSDRPRAQQTLARDLAALTHVLKDDETTEKWLRAFWETMAREWPGIPALRMDKFLYLCRCYVGAGLEWARSSGWDEERVERLVDVVRDVPLSTEEERREMTNGLRFHVLDIWADQLEECREDGVDMPLKQLMEPVKRLREKTQDKAVRNRAMETLKDKRLNHWGYLGVEDDARMQDSDGGGEVTANSIISNGDGQESDEDEWSGFHEG